MKNSTQKEKPASIKQQQKMAKNSTKSNKTAVHTFWKVKSGKGVFFTQQQEQGGPNAKGGEFDGWRPQAQASSRGIMFGCVRGFFFLDTSRICNNWSLIFRKSYGEGKSIVKLFLTFCKSHRGFTRQPVSPNVHLALTLQTPPKFHEKTPQREKKSEHGGGRGKKGRNFGLSGGGGPAEGPRMSRRVGGP